MSSLSSFARFDIEKFDGKNKFCLWKVLVKDVLIQPGLHKALKRNTSDVDDEKWEELDLRATSAIRLCLAKNVLPSVQNISTTKELWDKLKGLY
ncbi:cytochrome p450 [Sesbania bispinosa]|nr:cytochrome p450 [Sesbania bispinosa]